MQRPTRPNCKNSESGQREHAASETLKSFSQGKPNREKSSFPGQAWTAHLMSPMTSAPMVIPNASMFSIWNPPPRCTGFPWDPGSNPILCCLFGFLQGGGPFVPNFFCLVLRFVQSNTRVTVVLKFVLSVALAWKVSGGETSKRLDAPVICRDEPR